MGNPSPQDQVRDAIPEDNADIPADALDTAEAQFG